MLSGRGARAMSQSPAAKPVLGYARVSTDEQAREGVSLDAQAAKIRSYCSLHDLTLERVLVDEGLSGAGLNRPALQALLTAIDAGQISGVVVYKLDRLSRSTRDLLDLVDRCEEAGVALHSLQEKL